MRAGVLIDSFWRYDGAVARRLVVDVGRLLTRSVYVLVYTRPFGAAVFAGMKSPQGGEAGRDERTRTSRKATEGVSGVVGASPSGVAGTFSAPSGKRPVLSVVCEDTALESSAEPAAKLQRAVEGGSVRSAISQEVVEARAEERQTESTAFVAKLVRPVIALASDGTASDAPCEDA